LFEAEAKSSILSKLAARTSTRVGTAAYAVKGGEAAPQWWAGPVTQTSVSRWGCCTRLWQRLWCGVQDVHHTHAHCWCVVLQRSRDVLLPHCVNGVRGASALATCRGRLDRPPARFGIGVLSLCLRCLMSVRRGRCSACLLRVWRQGDYKARRPMHVFCTVAGDACILQCGTTFTHPSVCSSQTPNHHARAHITSRATSSRTTSCGTVRLRAVVWRMQLVAAECWATVQQCRHTSSNKPAWPAVVVPHLPTASHILGF
jgi:hypothetical protein